MHRKSIALLSFTAVASVLGLAAAEPEPRQPAHRTPPPEAFDACASKADGDACTVELPRHSIDGMCRPSREDEATLVCVPDRLPPPPRDDADDD